MFISCRKSVTKYVLLTIFPRKCEITGELQKGPRLGEPIIVYEFVKGIENLESSNKGPDVTVFSCYKTAHYISETIQCTINGDLQQYLRTDNYWGTQQRDQIR